MRSWLKTQWELWQLLSSVAMCGVVALGVGSLAVAVIAPGPTDDECRRLRAENAVYRLRLADLEGRAK